MKSLILSAILFCAIPISNFAQNLFDINTIRTIEIDFYDTNWDHLLDSLASLNAGTGSGTGRILANVTIDGIQFDSCGVRYKGNSSMDTASFKNPFNIDLNYTISGQEFMGKDKIKLANCFTDPSMVREALSYEIANSYMDAPHASFVKVFANADYLGIYTNTESVDNEFLNQYYGASDKPFFKCDPVSFELYGDNSNLAYHANPAVYDTLYDMKSTYGVTELQTLCYNLEYNIANIEQFLDVDRALWFLALSSILVHNDGYTAFGHNYYVYQKEGGIWSIILWDVNMSFGGLLWNGTNFFPLALTDLQTQDPYLHQLAYNFRPLIARLLSVPKYKRMYTAHFKTIQQEYISNGLYFQRAQFMSNLIDSDVQNENYNAYTYAQFQDNLVNTVGAWFDMRPGLQTLMTTRDNYLSGLPEFQALQPTISSISLSNPNPSPNSTVTITAQLANETSVELGFRHHKFDSFTKVPMFDDGAHGDGAANDGAYGANVAVQVTEMQYYIVAQNMSAAAFSPVRAEYEFYTLVPAHDLVINELMAFNTSSVADAYGEFDDWIELHNNTNAAIDLTGYYLSDDPADLTKWIFPSSSIAANGYLIVWADNDLWQTNNLHCNFSLNQTGETLILSNSNAEIINQVEYSMQQENISWARFPNGTGSFMSLPATFNAINVDNLALEEANPIENQLMIYPNPASEFIQVVFNNTENETVRMIDLTGKMLLETTKIAGETLTILTTDFSPGIYLVLTETGASRKVVIK